MQNVVRSSLHIKIRLLEMVYTGHKAIQSALDHTLRAIWALLRRTKKMYFPALPVLNSAELRLRTFYSITQNKQKQNSTSVHLWGGVIKPPPAVFFLSRGFSILWRHSGMVSMSSCVSLHSINLLLTSLPCSLSWYMMCPSSAGHSAPPIGWSGVLPSGL